MIWFVGSDSIFVQGAVCSACEVVASVLNNGSYELNVVDSVCICLHMAYLYMATHMYVCAYVYMICMYSICITYDI